MKFTVILCTVALTAIQTSLCESRDSDSERKQVQNGAQKVNEISDNTPRHGSKRPRPPQYMNILLEEFVANVASDGRRGRGTKPTSTRLFHAWLPTEINEADESHRATVSFQQTMPKRDFGSFTRTEITITLRDDVEDLQLPPKTTVSMSIHWDESSLQQELIQTQPIRMDKKFYSFNITEFISSCLQDNLTESYLVNISFQVTASQGRAQVLDFERLFDVQVDLPVIVYFYKGFVPPEMDLLKIKSRRQRSINEKLLRLRSSRPNTQCQRREFLVAPEEIQLPHIIGPRMLDLGYCSGSCQYPLLDGYFNYTMHSFLIDRFRMERTFDVPRGFPLSSCVPISYKPLSILEEVTSDSYQGEVVENMSVETCGCR